MKCFLRINSADKSIMNRRLHVKCDQTKLQCMLINSVKAVFQSGYFNAKYYSYNSFYATYNTGMFIMEM